MATVPGDGGLNSLIKATAFGVASNCCSVGPVAIGKGAHAVNVLAFIFTSMNLVVEVGLRVLLLLGRYYESW